MVGQGNGHEEEEQGVADEAEYDLMLHLERLESLREEMEELGVTTLAEVDSKIAELHRKMDEQEG